MTAPVRFDVISDIQGDFHDLDAALAWFAERGIGDALLVVGDLTPNGHADEYQALFDRLAASPHAPALFAVGNHDYYNHESNDVSIARFLEFTGMPAMYSAHEVGGVTVIRLGTLDGSERSGHCVILGDEQLAWLAETLDAQPIGKPVLVMSHHALPRTVSGSYDDPITQAPKLYLADYAESDRLLDILGSHPDVMFLSGHTHWSLYRSDWFARRTVGGGHVNGFACVNTGAVQRGFGPNGAGGEQPLELEENQGLSVVVDGSTIRIQALDFRRGKVIRTVEFRSGSADFVELAGGDVEDEAAQ
ncbi:metallophosphoesterase family protein [Antrihabitans cavernicola]|uniref:DUF4073 domain-containing protein n=1 Tax=Antrihabitans cavernicola TaxID=2495913 RepID=A0A5A7SFV4_9NOCA|nr:DUF4073 domain-containing protein [Spelaeibacter cavernicola]KAA0024072.1 DUF4073 domain-containing protein [Spelaeibacter cavernicola]